MSLFFFFKQKTAYEMRISDWSSDVCSSDLNLGTPDAPDARSVRRYLAQFLSDRRVVEIPQILWQPILRGIILTTRPKKSAHAYAQIWTDEGSPLAAITRAPSDALPRALGDTAEVHYAMRYGAPANGPSIDEICSAAWGGKGGQNG